MRREDHEFEVLARFEAVYPGSCVLNRDHSIKRGDKVSRVRYADNPMIPVPGVACKACTKTLPFAKV